MAVKVQVFRAQQVTHQVVVVIITRLKVNKQTTEKEMTVSNKQNGKSRPQYPENKPSTKEGKISGKGRTNK